MTIDSIRNGIVLDHIEAGKSMEIYRVLELSKLDCSVAIIKNAVSKKAGHKDIIKIDALIDINLDVLGYIDPGITVNVVKDGHISEKRKLSLPETVTGVIKCRNPRCITSAEQELSHVFRLSDRARGVYRCIYCESKAGTEA
ncbi:MAG: aspartate carbamoyltransferase regulatory subunit [Oscillospiraceae bacterium]|jgi:aspartate carbamoyltransferase regulatory subunit|nr:aspartate carbamoyltransferase regulatory subunit [Oscillospiraceae bacterium]